MTARELIHRLNAGWVMCEREPDPARRQHLEGHWLDLLAEYERANGGKT